MIYTRLIPFSAFDESASDQSASLLEDFGPGMAAFVDGSVGDAICDLLRAQIGSSKHNGDRLADLTIEGADGGVLLTAMVDRPEQNTEAISGFQLPQFKAVDQ
jgi:hypothetical protein